MTAAESKTCYRCHVEKPLEDFYRHKLRTDGRRGMCRDCELDRKRVKPREQGDETDSGLAKMLVAGFDLHREEWMERAACKTLPSDLFFPGRGDNFGTRRALAICENCPVREDCLDYALRLGFRTGGIWGGTTERQRRQLSREGRAS